jgi:hypothetical protein
MDDAVAPHELQARQHLHRESPDEHSREPGELVGLDQLVEVDAE